MPLSEAELEQCRATLGVERGATAALLQKAYLQRNFALLQAGASDEEKSRLRAAHEALLAELQAAERQQLAATKAGAQVAREEAQLAYALAELEREELARREPERGPFDPRSFDSAWINVLAPLVVAGLAILAQRSPLGFLLQGFHVWVHEFGHATLGWMTGHRALPLPIGWTPVAPEKSLFVYFGLLFLFGVLFVAGAKERKIWPMLLAVFLGLAQAAMTWRLPADRADLWIAFGGVGGEFYLTAAMMGLFYFRLPEKFRWDVCRYVFLFIGAGSFFATYSFWQNVKRGLEGIPYGSMIGGEEDAGGDMNRLHDDFGWTQHDIVRVYTHLGTACLAILAVLFVIFALRLDRLPARWLGKSGESM